MRKILKCAGYISFLLFTSLAHAAEKPQELSNHIKAEQPLGQGSLHKLFFHVYDTQLWTDAKQWSYDTSFALSITYRMHFTVKELVDRSFEEIRLHHSLTESEEIKQREALTHVFREVKKGDRITAFYTPKKGVAFYYNGTATGNLTSPEFSVQFMDIWLSENTSEPQVRRQLLGDS